MIHSPALPFTLLTIVRIDWARVSIGMMTEIMQMHDQHYIRRSHMQITQEVGNVGTTKGKKDSFEQQVPIHSYIRFVSGMRGTIEFIENFKLDKIQIDWKVTGAASFLCRACTLLYRPWFGSAYIFEINVFPCFMCVICCVYVCVYAQCTTTMEQHICKNFIKKNSDMKGHS